MKPQTLFGMAAWALLCLGLAGCGSVEREVSGAAQGSTYHIKMVLADEKKNPPEEIHGKVEEILAEIDRSMSNYRPDSEISLFNAEKNTDWHPISPGIVELIVIARQVHERSQGCYDLTVKPIFDVWGFARHEGHVPSQAEIDQVLPHVGMNKIELDVPGKRLRKLDPETRVDLSSIAQGYTVGQIARYLESRGIVQYLAEVGGEMQVRGSKSDGEPWRVAVEKPTPNAREIQKILAIKPEPPVAIMTSGTYRNYFEQDGQTYSHILNPKTGRPVSHHLLSVTLAYSDPTWADAWSTALLCLGETEGYEVARKEGLHALFIYDENHEIKEKSSSLLPGEESK